MLRGNRRKSGDGIDLIVCTSNASWIHKQDNKHSSICNPISLVSSDGVLGVGDGVGGDNSDFVHYRTEVVALELNALSTSGGFPAHIPVVRGKGA